MLNRIGAWHTSETGTLTLAQLPPQVPAIDKHSVQSPGTRQHVALNRLWSSLVKPKQTSGRPPAIQLQEAAVEGRSTSPSCRFKWTRTYQDSTDALSPSR